MEFTKEDILAQLDRITSDKAFSRSKINVRLLSFLVRATLDNQDVKETTIGTAFFGAKYDPIKSDNKVRVYVYHLRKKLAEYYANAGSSTDIVFRIAKGQYLVQFETYTTPQESNEKKTPQHKIERWLGAAVLLASLVAFWVYRQPASSFWKTLMQNDFPTTVVFGDYFTIEGTVATGGAGIIRDYEINSEQELQDFLTTHPEQRGKLHASRHHYFNWLAPYCSKTITAYWADYSYSFDMKQVSEWNVSQLGKENVVYFGQSKSMGVLKNILIENFPQYTYKSQRIFRKDTLTGKTKVYGDFVTHSDKIIDYTIVAKLSMPQGTEMRFFLSDQDCGAISALNYFTQNDSVRAFYARHQLDQADDFLALFKVTGWQRKVYDMEFILIDKK